MNVDALTFREVAALPPLEEIDDGELFALSLSNNTATFTHGLHRFPAKFIPQIPSWALDQLAPSRSVVLDPFMGSGTTLVEGLLRGGRPVGIDIDPLAQLIARAKTEVPDPGRIEILGKHIKEQWREPARHLRPPMPDIANFDHWFTPEAWGWLQSLSSILLKLDCSDGERRFLLVVFSSILRLVSNADDQSQKTYVSGTRPKTLPSVSEAFWRAFGRASAGLAELAEKMAEGAAAEVLCGADSRSLPLPDRSVDLIVTSPPYLDSVDYPYNLMLEYFWLGPVLGVPDRAAFNRLRRSGIGAKNPNASVAVPGCLESFVNLETVPPSRHAAITGYFSGMEAHFRAASRALKVGGRYVLVIGNSQTRSGALPLHDCLLTIAAASSLSLEKAFAYRIRRHYMKFPRSGRGGIILVDWILVLRKEKSEVKPPAPLPLQWLTLPPTAVAH